MSRPGQVARRIAGLALPAVLLAGCAVHYFDPETGTEHVWGIGHMAMTPGTPTEGLKAVGRRIDVVGLTVGKTQDGVHLEIGWGGHQRFEIVADNVQLCLAWPRGSFYNVRVGSAFPPSLDDCGRAEREKAP